MEILSNFLFVFWCSFGEFCQLLELWCLCIYDQLQPLAKDALFLGTKTAQNGVVCFCLVCTLYEGCDFFYAIFRIFNLCLALLLFLVCLVYFVMFEALVWLFVVWCLAVDLLPLYIILHIYRLEKQVVTCNQFMINRLFSVTYKTFNILKQHL